MGKKTSYIGDDMDDFDDESDGDDEAHVDHGRRESRNGHGHRDTARHRLDMRQDELWLKQQLADWDEESYDDNGYV